MISSAVNVTDINRLLVSGSSEISQVLSFLKTMNNLFGLICNKSLGERLEVNFMRDALSLIVNSSALVMDCY